MPNSVKRILRVDRVRRKLPLFVQNAGFPRAMQLLDDTRIVVISGVAGYRQDDPRRKCCSMPIWSRDTKPVVIQAEIAEAKKVLQARRQTGILLRRLSRTDIFGGP